MTPLALDIAIGSIIFLSTLIAYFRGIIREFFTLAGLGLATYVSYKGGHLLVPGLQKWLGAATDSATEKATVLGLLKPTMASYVIAYGGVFLLIFVLMIVVRILTTRAIQDAGLGVLDRLIGAAFGFARGFLLVFVVYATCFYLITKDKFPEWAKNSYSVPVLDNALAWTSQHIELDKIIKDEGSGISIKLDKVDPDKLGKDAGEAAKELKDEVKKEEQQVQKAVPDTTPAPVPTAPAPSTISAPEQSSTPPAAPQPPIAPPAPPAPPAAPSAPGAAPSP